MKIIAFDLGSTFAWATNSRVERPWGHHELQGERAHRQGEFLRLLYGELATIEAGDLVEVFPPDLFKRVDAVVYETPFARGYHATRSLWGMAGVLEACATEHRKPVVDVAVATIKKFATGHGRGPKVDMISAARRRGYTGRNEHEADAYCLLKYAEENLERLKKGTKT